MTTRSKVRATRSPAPPRPPSGSSETRALIRKVGSQAAPLGRSPRAASAGTSTASARTIEAPLRSIRVAGIWKPTSGTIASTSPSSGSAHSSISAIAAAKRSSSTSKSVAAVPEAREEVGDGEVGALGRVGRRGDPRLLEVGAGDLGARASSRSPRGRSASSRSSVALSRTKRAVSGWYWQKAKPSPASPIS